MSFDLVCIKRIYGLIGPDDGNRVFWQRGLSKGKVKLDY